MARTGSVSGSSSGGGAGGAVLPRVAWAGRRPGAVAGLSGAGGVMVAAGAGWAVV